MKTMKLFLSLFFIFISLSSFGIQKKIKMFSFVERDKDKFFALKNDYSYGVIMSSYNLLRLLKDYEFDKPTIINFNYPNYREMIFKNRGYDLFVLGEYSITNEEITYRLMIFNKEGIKLLETDIKGTTDVDSLFEIADKIALTTASFITSKRVEIVKLKIDITGDNNRMINIELNGNIIFRNVGNGFVGITPIVSGSEYIIRVIDANTEDVLSTFQFFANKKEIEEISIQNSEKVLILSEDIKNLSVRKIFFNISTGSPGMINLGLTYKWKKQSVEFSIGSSYYQIDTDTYLKMSFEIGSRYNLWRFGFFDIGIIIRGYLGYYSEGLRGIYIITGTGIDLNLLKLDIGITGGILDFKNLVFGPYWKFSFNF